MKNLSEIKNKTVMVLETSENSEEKKYLKSIGIFPETLISVLKNSEISGQPLLIEVNGSRFMISREVAKKIFVVDVLEKQEVLFKGNKTQQREIILHVIQEFSDHFSLKECVQKAQEKDETIGNITVYRTIKKLREKDILEEIVMPNGEKKYEIHKEHHDHIFCKNCGNIIEFYSEEIEALQEKIAEQHGVKLFSHSLTMIGLECNKCK